MTSALVKKKAVKKPRKCKTNIPVVIALTRNEKDAISAPPWRSLKNCMLGRGTPTDWYNLMFRINTAHELAVALYDPETKEAIYKVLLCLLTVKNSRKADNIWAYSEEDIKIIDSGLVAADQLTEDTTRRAQHEAMLKTRDYLKQFL